jgi:hypothetical protein
MFWISTGPFHERFSIAVQSPRLAPAYSSIKMISSRDARHSARNHSDPIANINRREQIRRAIQSCCSSLWVGIYPSNMQFYERFVKIFLTMTVSSCLLCIILSWIIRDTLYLVRECSWHWFICTPIDIWSLEGSKKGASLQLCY